MARQVRIALHLRLGVTFISGVVRGFHSVAAAKNWDVILLPPEKRPFHPTYCWEPQVLVLTSEIWRKLSPAYLRGKIVVGIRGSGATMQGVPCVILDDDAVGREAARHLLAKGLHTFGAYGMSGIPFSVTRIAGFRAEVEAAGGSYRPEMDHVPAQAHPDSREYPSRRNLLRWLRALPKPAGVFVPCDLWGWEVTSACQELRLSVPDDVSVVSVDNEELLCERTVPPLSSVAVPWNTLGKEAAHLVDRLLTGRPRPPEPIVISPIGVVARRSTDMFAVENPLVAEALRFIRDHAHRVISVPDILRAVPAYRHQLERGFRAYVGRTIMEEVQRVHLERAKRLLALTDLSIAQIADKSGFADLCKLDIAFRKHIGRTPTAYRGLFQLPEPNPLSRSAKSGPHKRRRRRV